MACRVAMVPLNPPMYTVIRYDMKYSIKHADKQCQDQHHHNVQPLCGYYRCKVCHSILNYAHFCKKAGTKLL